MSDNARFHSKLHRKNHHTLATPGYPDSATDPIASESEPFQGDFFINGNLSVTGALNTVYNTLSNINIPSPVLSAGIGFAPSNSLIVVLSGIRYAIPLTLATSSSATNTLTGRTTFLDSVSVIGGLSSEDTFKWNDVYTVVSSNSSFWDSAYVTLTGDVANNWNYAYNSSLDYASVSGSFVTYLSADSRYMRLSSQAYSLSGNAITPVAGSNTSSGIYTNIGGGAGNTTTGDYGSVVGGQNNCSLGSWSSIAGGCNNIAYDSTSFIGGGSRNTTLSGGSIVGGGSCNSARDLFTVVIGGSGNIACAATSSIIGGVQNTVSGVAATVVGGQYNTANSNCSFIAGGICNITNSFDNTFILGSNIRAVCANYTYVNNISAQCFVQAASAYVDFVDVSPGVVGTTLPNTRAQFFSNTDTYSQVNHQNVNTGSSSSTDFIATNDVGNDTCGYVDLGINSSSYSSPSFDITGPQDAYLYTAGQGNLVVGTSGNGDVVLFTGGTQAINERMRITDSGYIGIGTSEPTFTLTVVGDISASGFICGVNNVYQTLAGGIFPANGDNTASGLYSVVGGGSCNGTSSDTSGIFSGCCNSIMSDSSVIGGGGCNTSSGIYTSILGGSCNTITTGQYSTINGGLRNSIQQTHSYIGGGCTNTVTSSGTVIAGGVNNCAVGTGAFIGGGINNVNRGNYAIIIGGCNNNICEASVGSTVLGVNITAEQPFTTYVNNLSTNGSICGSTLYGDGSNITGLVLPSDLAYRYTSVFSGTQGFNNISNTNEPSNNALSGAFSFIASGSGNSTSGFNNTFILGSGLSATCADYTFVNNISSQGAIIGSTVNASCLLTNSVISSAVSGSSLQKFPIYDSSGVLIGYIPIYPS